MIAKARIIFRFIFLLLCVTVTTITAGYSQQFTDSQLREWEKHPHWITMMDDSTANYFAVTAAFDAFWKDREMPVEEDEVLGADRSEREDEGFLKRIFRSKEKEARKEKAMRSKYQFEVKKYKHWKLLVQPWIQEDGSILYPSQQEAILKNVR